MSKFEGEPRAPQSRESRKTEKKDRREGSRFNEEVGKFLEQEFKERGDVRRDFITHAFPIKNLGGIVEEGGLRTGEFLEKKGRKFAKGSAEWTLGGTPPRAAGVDPAAIWFGRGFIHDTYTSRGGSEAVLLFPVQEFERLRRLQEDSGPELGERIIGANDEYWVRTGERWSDAGVGSTVKSAVRIAKEKERREMERCEKKYEKMADAAGGAFERDVKTLTLEGLPLEWRIVWQDATSVELHLDQMERETQKDLQKANEQLPSYRRDQEAAHLEEMRASLEDAKKRLLAMKQPRGLATRTLDYLTGKGALLRTRYKNLEQWVGAQEESIRNAEALLGAASLAQQKLDFIKRYREAIWELKMRLNALSRETIQERKQIKKAYETFGMRGEKAQVIQERVRGMYQTQEAENALQVDLSHGVLLVERRHVDEVREALQDKPGLISRVIVFDRSRFLRELSSGSSTSLNIIFERLAGTGAGVDLLTAVQRGEHVTRSAIEGVWRLEDYVEDEEREIRKAA